MSSPDDDRLRLRQWTLTVHAIVALLMLLGIAVLIVYTLRLGSLSSSDAQTSFGFAFAMMLFMASVLFHVVDRTYRAWPLGRRLQPKSPGAAATEAQLLFLEVVAFGLASVAIAYVIEGWIS